MGGCHLDIGRRLLPEIFRLLLCAGDDLFRLPPGVRYDTVGFLAGAREQLFSFFLAFGKPFLIELLCEFL